MTKGYFVVARNPASNKIVYKEWVSDWNRAINHCANLIKVYNKSPLKFLIIAE